MSAPPDASVPGRGRVLVTGATGYIGGRLAPRLLAAGYPVRCLVRSAASFAATDWATRVEVAEGDALIHESLLPALRGVDVAYYLIHSMRASPEFYQLDLEAARNFGHAARSGGVRRIIYLGGLGNPAHNLSTHLRSRQETGRALAESGVPVTEFRAAIVVGAGSFSFEMIRALVDRLPVMLCPRWVYSRVQPIGVDDGLAYLLAAPTTPASAGRVMEIGGADVLTYAGLLREYARLRGLRRILIPVPFLTPHLSSRWINLIAPVDAPMARALIEGLRNEVVVRDPLARSLFPHISPITYEQAVRRALADRSGRRAR